MSKSPKSSIIKQYHSNVFSSSLYEFLIVCIQFKNTTMLYLPLITNNMHADWRLFFSQRVIPALLTIHLQDYLLVLGLFYVFIYSRFQNFCLLYVEHIRWCLHAHTIQHAVEAEEELCVEVTVSFLSMCAPGIKPGCWVAFTCLYLQEPSLMLSLTYFSI